MRRWPWRPKSGIKLRHHNVPIVPSTTDLAEPATRQDDRTAGRCAVAPKDIAVTTLILLATFAVAFVGGYLGKLLNFPLPCMTGSLMITAALGLAGVRYARSGRRVPPGSSSPARRSAPPSRRRSW